MAAANPARAQTIAMSAGNSDALASAAESAEATDPRRVEVIARGVPDDYFRAAALARIASVMTALPGNQ